MLLELYIENNGKLYRPVILGDITWQTERNGTVGELNFVVKKDSKLNFTEGNKVTFKVDEKGIFKGYIFTKSRDKNQYIEVTAKDQFRYLQNKDTRKNPVRTAGSFIKTVAKEHNLKVGVVEDTKEKLPSRIESETSYIDMIMNDIVATTDKTGVDYTFFDSFGNLTLKSYGNMKVDYTVTVNNIQNFAYSSSIDGETYNQIKIANSDENEVINHGVSNDPVNIKRWGVLQYVTKLEDNQDAHVVAKELLNKYNRKVRKLSVTKAFGHKNVRAGSVIKVILPLGDMALNSEMIVDKCTHIFTEDTHFMDLTLVSYKGGEFVG